MNEPKCGPLTAAANVQCPNGYDECWQGCCYPGRCGRYGATMTGPTLYRQPERACRGAPTRGVAGPTRCAAPKARAPYRPVAHIPATVAASAFGFY